MGRRRRKKTEGGWEVGEKGMEGSQQRREDLRFKGKELAREGRELRKIVRRELRKEKALEGHWKCKGERKWKGSSVMRFIT